MPILKRDGREYCRIVVLFAEGFGEIVHSMARLAVDDWSKQGHPHQTLFAVTGQKRLAQPIGLRKVPIRSNTNHKLLSENQVSSEYEVSAYWLQSCGLEVDQILYEPRSDNTAQQVAYLQELIPDVFRNNPGVNQFEWVVVAHDLHLPRAVWLAYRAGFPVVRALGAKFYPKFEWDNRRLPWFWLPRCLHRELELAASRRDRDLGLLSDEDYCQIYQKKYPDGVEVVIR